MVLARGAGIPSVYCMIWLCAFQCSLEASVCRCSRTCSPLSSPALISDLHLPGYRSRHSGAALVGRGSPPIQRAGPRRRYATASWSYLFRLNKRPPPPLLHPQHPVTLNDDDDVVRCFIEATLNHSKAPGAVRASKKRYPFLPVYDDEAHLSHEPDFG